MLGLLTGGLAWLKIGAAVIVVSLIGLGYWHYTSLLSEREALRIETEIQARELQGWADRWENLRAALDEVEKLRREAREYHDDLQELLAKHDLNKLALEKPYLIQRRATAATTARLRVLECVTGRAASCGTDQPTAD